ncbi:hypothetical protein BO83DRAFT_433443 [Aspergillus eucalypticola CBS 122712]|uniref:Uncharacterized protein n=1 Tax=Aspergillus eucalypticola (strain CBS 122712 / IBT 29274) TaxID=1448314 RepID=A0A317WKB7_ASPEC|nr:uncharacterized protein BO83DRAFT_433443 [Aspergillus eucalypticola CBS 122712]PWY85518.1 hypothetical protein BO83DRAFT_433443 [Aspergillus eucalypticola CBS 122712]
MLWPQFGFHRPPYSNPKFGLSPGIYNSRRTLWRWTFFQRAAKMPWSIDTSLSFITLLLTRISFLLKIWNHVANWSYRRVLPQGVARSTPDASILRRQQRHQQHQLHHVDPEILLESGLHPGVYQTLVVNQVCEATPPKASSPG